MEDKKAKKVRIEENRSTWLLMGFITVLAFMFISFEWAQKDVEIDTSMMVKEGVFEEVLIPVTRMEKPQPPPPPTPTSQDLLVIVENTAAVEESQIMGSEEDGEALTVRYIPPVIEPDKPVEDEIFINAEVMPQFPGGTSELFRFLNNNINYPVISLEQNSQGKVIVQFVVDKNGNITDPEVVRGIDPHLDKEALRVVRSMPKWKPGQQNGKAVRVKFTLPVTFRIQ